MLHGLFSSSALVRNLPGDNCPHPTPPLSLPYFLGLSLKHKRAVCHSPLPASLSPDSCLSFPLSFSPVEIFLFFRDLKLRLDLTSGGEILSWNIVSCKCSAVLPGAPPPQCPSSPQLQLWCFLGFCTLACLSSSTCSVVNADCLAFSSSGLPFSCGKYCRQWGWEMAPGESACHASM